MSCGVSLHRSGLGARVANREDWQVLAQMR
jgi:hypothetical protein